MEQEFLIALGSNLGSAAGAPEATLAAAIKALVARGITLRRISRFYATPCFPAGAGPDYVNACAAVMARMDASQFLLELHAVEACFGRKRAQRWGSRSLDLDLLAMGDTVLPDAATQARWRGLDPAEQRRAAPGDLVLPHPRMQDRAFVLGPLADIAPHWQHPTLRRDVTQMLAALPAPDRAALRPLTPEPACKS